MSDALELDDLRKAKICFLSGWRYEPDGLILSPRMAEEYPRFMRRETIRAQQQERRWRGRHYLNRLKRGKPARRRRH